MAEAGGLTAAARAEGLSQPAVSKSLSELEDLLGARLLSRQGRRVALTAEGEAFRRHAREAVASLDAAARAVQPGQGPQRLAVFTTGLRMVFSLVLMALSHCEV